MKRYSFVAGLALAVLAILGLAGPAPAGDQVPFKGNLSGSVTRDNTPPPIHANVAATGTATQLGLFFLEIPHTVTPPTAHGFYHFTAANGDTLTAEFDGISNLVAPGILHIVETATIKGGTGRFAGASGSFTAERWYDMLAGTTVGSFEGTISSTGN